MTLAQLTRRYGPRWAKLIRWCRNARGGERLRRQAVLRAAVTRKLARGR